GSPAASKCCSMRVTSYSSSCRAELRFDHRHAHAPNARTARVTTTATATTTRLRREVAGGGSGGAAGPSSAMDRMIAVQEKDGGPGSAFTAGGGAVAGGGFRPCPVVLRGALARRHILQTQPRYTPGAAVAITTRDGVCTRADLRLSEFQADAVQRLL